MPGALGDAEDSIDAFGLDDYLQDFLTALELVEEDFPSRYRRFSRVETVNAQVSLSRARQLPRSDSPAQLNGRRRRIRLYLSGACSQEMAAVLEEMEQLGFVPMSASQPVPLRRAFPCMKLEAPASTAPAAGANRSKFVSLALHAFLRQRLLHVSVAVKMEPSFPTFPTRIPTSKAAACIVSSVAVKMEPTSPTSTLVGSSSPFTPLAKRRSLLPDSPKLSPPNATPLSRGSSCDSDSESESKSDSVSGSESEPDSDCSDVASKAPELSPATAAPLERPQAQKSPLDDRACTRCQVLSNWQRRRDLAAPFALQDLQELYSDFESEFESESESKSKSESSSDSEEEVISTCNKPKTMPPTPSSAAKRKRNLSMTARPSESESDSASDCEMVASKKPKLSPPSAMPLARFFASYPKYSYDRAGPASQQFNALRGVYKLERGRPAAEEAYAEYNRALGLTFSQNYGDAVDNLANWQRLCREVRVVPVPETLAECEREIEAAHVNLMDLIDVINTKEPVHRFKTEQELSEYTLAARKVFPSHRAYKGPLLRYLLRRIFHPPPKGVVRRGSVWAARCGYA
ncbi:hypothetical protein B0H17DRAFT_1207800 [Mycena rosella]|uniref:Uncharacterized protein n=1 Tax=Mycena rosella TaxID=1033263 RepID=A0AAD7GC25_MYCRO|nr:hypothetical protein B0H17DRAFT_1207800 [Mycena rosella]